MGVDHQRLIIMNVAHLLENVGDPWLLGLSTTIKNIDHWLSQNVKIMT